MNPGATPTVDHRRYLRLPTDLIVSIRKRPSLTRRSQVIHDLSEGGAAIEVEGHYSYSGPAA